MTLLGLMLILAGLAIVALVLTLWLVPESTDFDSQGREQLGKGPRP